LAEGIEVGVFTDEPGVDSFDAADVLVMERRAIRSGRQELRFVTERKPVFVGVDPYNYYVDRVTWDNVRGVK
jgi:hypothetical protein